MNRLPAHAMALPTASALDSPPAVKVSPVGTAWRSVLLAGGLLGGAWLCWPPLAPLCAHVALLPLLRLWRDEASPALLAAASLATMVCAHLLALGYFLFIDPLPALVAIAAQSVLATLPLLVLAMAVRRAPARRWLWALPALWAANEQFIAQLPTMVPMPLGGALAVWPSGIWFYAWTGVLGGTLLLVTSQIWWVCSPLPAPIKARRALLGLALIHGLGLSLPPAESADLAREPALALVRTGAAPTNTDSPAWYDQALHQNSQAIRDGAQLLIWPEAMISWRVWQEEEHPLRRALLAHLRAHAVPLLIGFNATADAFTLYNGAALLHPGQQTDTAPAYFKRWLMPYRENPGLFGLGRSWIRAGKASAALPERAVARTAAMTFSLPADADETDQMNVPTATNHPATTSEGSANLSGAWAITTGHLSLVVAVLDTGLLPDHQDLAGRTVAGYDFISTTTVANDGDGREASPTDPGDCTDANTCRSSWHGTHVAGTIGATANNGQGITGINWQSKIQALRVLGVDGGYTSDIADAIRWGAGASTMDGSNPWPQGANPTPARVLNLSLGGSGVCNTTTQEAIDTAIGLGTVVIVAAGNENQSLAEVPKQPATCNQIITVTGAARDGSRASYRNYDSNGSNHIAIAAPGGDQDAMYGADGVGGILSTLDGGTTSALNDHAYAWYQGTSMATPHVAGVVSGHRNFKRPQQGLAQRPGRVCNGLKYAKLGFSTGAAVESAGPRPRTGRSLGLDLRVAPDVNHVAPTWRAAPPRLRLGVAASGDVYATVGTAQAANSCPASHARPLGGGCGSSPRCVRIFSITGRSRMAAMIFSSPLPQFGQCCMSTSKTRLSSRAQLMRCTRAWVCSASQSLARVALVACSAPRAPAASPARAASRSAPAPHGSESGAAEAWAPVRPAAA